MEIIGKIVKCKCCGTRDKYSLEPGITMAGLSCGSILLNSPIFCFPGGGSSTTDHEELRYDAASNVTRNYGDTCNNP
jgi:hypothetical protein